jgi:hypothetical protein
MAITTWDTCVFVMEELMLSAVIIWAVVAIVKIHKMEGFKWVQLLIALVIFADIGDFMFNYFYYMLNDPDYLPAHSDLVRWGMAVACMLLYFNNNLYCWLYSLKQWTISIEVPRQL